MNSTRSVLQSISTVDPELGKSIKPFVRYIDQMIMKYIGEKVIKRDIFWKDYFSQGTLVKDTKYSPS
jgi:hypothetical protein